MKIEVEVEAPAWLRAVPDATVRVKWAASAGLARLTLSVAPETLNVLLTDDVEIQALNARFRGKDAPTNVLSFPSPPNTDGHLGDIALAYETCAREAMEQGKPLAAHLVHLTVHGMLHLLGCDHDDPAGAEEMEAIERDVLAGLGLPDPYVIEA